jgi:hypothetical protein
LLGYDLEMGGYTKPVSGQRLGKNVPAAKITHEMGETECFCVVRAAMLFARDKVS